MKILIFGGNGFLGRHLARELSNEYSISIISRNGKGKNIINGDITQLKSLEKIDQHDIIVNLVGLSPIKKPPKEYSYTKVHVDGMRNLIIFAKSKNISRVLHISALGAERDSDFEYLSSKAEAEELLLNSGLEYIIIKPSLIMGEDNELNGILRKLSIKDHSIFPTIKQRVQPIDVDHLSKEIRRFIGGWNSHKNSIKIFTDLPVKSFSEAVVEGSQKYGLKVSILPLPTALFIYMVKIGSLLGFLPHNAHLALEKDNIAVNENQ